MQVTESKKERSAVSFIHVQVVDGSDSPPTGRIQLACAGLACSFPTAPADPNRPLAMEVCTGYVLCRSLASMANCFVP